MIAFVGPTLWAECTVKPVLPRLLPYWVGSVLPTQESAHGTSQRPVSNTPGGSASIGRPPAAFPYPPSERVRGLLGLVRRLGGGDSPAPCRAARNTPLSSRSQPAARRRPGRPQWRRPSSGLAPGLDPAAGCARDRPAGGAWQPGPVPRGGPLRRIGPRDRARRPDHHEPKA